MNIEEISNFSEVEKLCILLGAKHMEDENYYSQALLACEKIWKHIEIKWSEEQISIFFKAVSKYLQDILAHQSISDMMNTIDVMPHTISDGLDNLTPIIESVEEEYDVRFEY